jgi:DNA mismatch repair protein MutL
MSLPQGRNNMPNARIKILSDQVANLIAAGEVVERPASVIKELIENSLDANATRVEVEIKNAGFKSMRVTDNGQGMPTDDAQLAFSRHATSKIRKAADLETIDTLGFRGEALPSIAAVSHVELLTRPEKQSVGFRIKLSAGKIKSKGETGCAAGTTIIIEDLFFNTPARRKFMKTHSTEQSHIVQVVELAAISHKRVGFKLIVDRRELFNCPPTKNLSDRLITLYGKALPQNMLPVEREAGGIWIRGRIANPSDHRNTRQGMRFFINQRPVEHRGISHAVIQAYRNLVPAGRFPICYLFFTMPNHLLDVNVHPAKREVRLRDEAGIHHLVHTTIQTALQQGDLTGTKPSGFMASPEIPAKPAKSNYSSQSLPMGWSGNRVKESVASYIYKRSTDHTEIEGQKTPSVEEIIEEADVRVVGQVGRTYIAAQDEKGFFLVDQHAAHERMLYESFLKWPQDLPRQNLLLPLTFELKPSQTSLLNEAMELFTELGLEISPMGGATYTIQTQPDPFIKGDLIGIVLEVLEWMTESGKKPDKNRFRERTLQSMACKAAVKAGDRMQQESMVELIKQIQAYSGLPTCPHGRPFIFRLSWDELDKIFKRDYAD